MIWNNLDSEDEEVTIKPVESKKEVEKRKDRLKKGKKSIQEFDEEQMKKTEQQKKKAEKRTPKSNIEAPLAKKKYVIPKNQPSGKCHFYYFPIFFTLNYKCLQNVYQVLSCRFGDLFFLVLLLSYKWDFCFLLSLVQTFIFGWKKMSLNKYRP